MDFDLDGELLNAARLGVTGGLTNCGVVAEHASIRIGYETPGIDTDPAFPIEGALGRITGPLSASAATGLGHTAYRLRLAATHRCGGNTRWGFAHPAIRFR